VDKVLQIVLTILELKFKNLKESLAQTREEELPRRPRRE